jgi:Zn finger protein HypA/HybF involved in hydrogenase expression
MSEIRNRNTVEGDKYRDLAICNDCLWAASLLRTAPDIYNCPACKSKNLDIVPVTDQESYTVRIKNKRGLEIEFSK